MSLPAADTPADPADLPTSDLSDDDLFELAARIVARPKAVPADSFRLHAPLELLARRALLTRVDPARHELARQRMMSVAAAYAKSGEPLEGTVEPRAELAPDSVVASLAAAGHAGIYFSLLARVAPRSPAAIAMLQPLARELSRFPDWNVEWVDGEQRTGSGDDAVLTPACCSTRHASASRGATSSTRSSTRSMPTASHATSSVPCSEPAAIFRARRGRSPASAAWSMLQDDPAHAPYGWTHCLTLPQAICNIASTTGNPGRACRVIAATHVVGFRAALTNTTVFDRYDPDPVGVDWQEAFDASPQTAAATVHHAPPSAVAAITTELATRVALHPDAHVAKYTLACFDAARADPDHERLFLSAAAFLHGWWAGSSSARGAREATGAAESTAR